MSDELRVPTKRRLTDLYMKGRKVVIADDDPDEEGVEVWVSKLTPLQRKNAGDKANGARAATLALQKLPEDSEEKLEFYDQLERYGLESRETLIDFIIAPEVQKLTAAHEAEIAAEDEWSENDYLDALTSAWNDGLQDKYIEDENDDEAKRVYSELKRFSEQVNKLVEADADGYRKDYDDVSDEKLATRVVERLIDNQADIAWITEFQRWQVFFAVRLPENHKMQYFEEKTEVDELDPKVFSEIYQAFNDLTVDSLEGKD